MSGITKNTMSEFIKKRSSEDQTMSQPRKKKTVSIQMFFKPPTKTSADVQVSHSFLYVDVPV